MATRVAYEHAASEFAATGRSLRILAADVDTMDPAAIVRGGRLGRLVPHHLEQSSVMARIAAAQVDAAAAECRRRAAVIAAYEAELRVYNGHVAAYLRSFDSWRRRYDAWAAGPGDLRPPVPPTAPVAPAPPPPWADVLGG